MWSVILLFHNTDQSTLYCLYKFLWFYDPGTIICKQLIIHYCHYVVENHNSASQLFNLEAPIVTVAEGT